MIVFSLAEPGMLDVPGCEMVWIGYSEDDLDGVLGELGREIENGDRSDERSAIG